MKTFIYCWFCVFYGIVANAQDEKVAYHVENFMTPQSFYLNGGARAAVGGKSRVVVPIELPVGTVEWYYAITTSASEQQKPKIDLAKQLLTVLDPAAGIASSALSLLMSPVGSNVCCAYLSPDMAESYRFAKQEITAMHFIPEGTRENFKNGVVNIRADHHDKYFIVLRNPSAMSGINITIEVVAIVAEKHSVVKTEAQEKASLYSQLGLKALNVNELDKCLEYSKRALEYDNTLPGAQERIALVNLLKGVPTATDDYIKAIESIKQSAKAKDYLETSLKDINIAMQRNPNLKDAELIRSLLEEEFKRYVTK